MKRFTLVLALVATVVLATTGILTATDESTSGPKGKEVNITGRLSCTFCSLSHPGMTCKKGCCAGCIKAGDPPLLVDEQGSMYLLVGNEIKKPAITPERLEMAGDQVAVKGLLVKGKGIQAIFVDSIEKR